MALFWWSRAPQKSHWGVTKVFSKIASSAKAAFARTGLSKIPFPRRFLQVLAVAEAEAWSPQPFKNNVV